MIPLYRYNQDTYTPFIFPNRRYWLGELCCRWAKRQWKLGEIEEAKKWYHFPVGYQKQDLTTPLRTFYGLPIRKKLPYIELGLLLNIEGSKTKFDEVLTKLNSRSKDTLKYAIGCALVAKFLYPIDNKTRLHYRDEAENCYYSFLEQTLSPKDQVFFSYKLIAKPYAATFRLEKCIEIFERLNENHIPSLTLKEQCWTLLKFAKLLLPLDPAYGMNLLTTAAKIIPLEDKVAEAELHRLSNSAGLM